MGNAKPLKQSKSGHKIVWSPGSVRAIGDHVAFISQDSSSAAEKWATDLFRRVEELLEFPEVGRRSSYQAVSGIREIVIDSKFILTYKIDAKGIRILMFFHAAQTR